MNQIIKDLLQSGIPVTMTWDKELNQELYSIPGFYKSDTITLKEGKDPDGPIMIATDRYNEQTEIYSIGNLASLNLAWWNRSRDISDNPDILWRKIFIKEGLVKEETIITYKPVK